MRKSRPPRDRRAAVRGRDRPARRQLSVTLSYHSFFSIIIYISPLIPCYWSSSSSASVVNLALLPAVQRLVDIELSPDLPRLTFSYQAKTHQQRPSSRALPEALVNTNSVSAIPKETALLDHWHSQARSIGSLGQTVPVSLHRRRSAVARRL